MKWIIVIAFCFRIYGCDINCNRTKRTLGDLLTGENIPNALHVHVWNDMNREEMFVPNIFGQMTTPQPPSQQDTIGATISPMQQPSELPQERFRKSDRDLYEMFYKLNPRKNKNIRPSNANFYPSIMNYVPNGYKTNIRVQPVSKLPPVVRQSMYGMFKSQNQHKSPNYYTNVYRKKQPRLPTQIESNLIRFASGKVLANEPKPQNYHTFQLHEAMPGQILLPPTRIPLFKPVPPPIKIVPVLDDFAVLRVPQNQIYRPQVQQSQLYHPTTFQQPNNTHPYPFHTTAFGPNKISYFNAYDAMTPNTWQHTAPATDAYKIPTTTKASVMALIDATTTPSTTATTTDATTTMQTHHVTHSRPTYPNVVYAVPDTTTNSTSTSEMNQNTRPPTNRKKNNRNEHDEFRIMTINKQQNGNKKGTFNATTRPTFVRRRPMRLKQKQKLKPLPGSSPIVQIRRPSTMTTKLTTEHPQFGEKLNQRNETDNRAPFRIIVNSAEENNVHPSINPMAYGNHKYQTTMANGEQQKPPKQDSIIYGRPIEALIVDPPEFQNGTIEVNTPYSKQISNRNDQTDQENATNIDKEELNNLNRDIKRVLQVTMPPKMSTELPTDDDNDDIDSDPLLMHNLNKNEMLPIAAKNIFDSETDNNGKTETETRAVNHNRHTAFKRRSDNDTTIDVDSNAIDVENAKPFDENKYYKWYSRYAADNKRKYGRAIISEHFKKVEIEPNVAWVILPR